MSRIRALAPLRKEHRIGLELRELGTNGFGLPIDRLPREDRRRGL